MPQPPQFDDVSRAVQTFEQHPWPAPQQLLPQAIWLAVQAGLHAVPAALQPVDEHVVVVGARQVPLASQAAALVWTPPVHVLAGPQVAPAPLFVVSMHTWDPVVHAVIPFLHGFAGWQV